MANIKFSQFTVGNTESDIDFVVGYKGANNIQISPANLLSATLAGYLPLTGGTMSGTSGIHMPDNFALKAGNSQDLQIYHGGVDSYIVNETGNLQLIQKANDKDIQFFSDDGSGGFTEYFRLDGGDADGTYTYTRRPDGGVSTFGNDKDLRIWHDPSTNFSYIRNYTNDFSIENVQDNGDIIFKSDNGAGNVTAYITLDGSNVRTRIDREMRFMDTIPAKFGTGGDLILRHNATDSYIENNNGDLLITNNANDKDIKFSSDDGSGGTTEYMRIDGGQEKTLFIKNTEHQNGIRAQFGNSGNFSVLHDGTNAFLINDTGNLTIQNNTDDADIIFKSDNGSGGIATYFFLDGSATQTTFQLNTRHNDTVKAKFGNSGDLEIYHDGSTSNIANYTNNLSIINHFNDGDIKFFSDDGSGGVTEYFRVDGGTVQTLFSKEARFLDNVSAQFGSSGELRLYHTGTGSVIQNSTGNLTIQQDQNDGDIIFRSDDGAGGTAQYLKLWGAIESLAVYKDMLFVNDGNGGKLKFGASQDLQIYHNGSNSFIQDIGTGGLVLLSNQTSINNASNSEDIAKFIADGAVELYYDSSKKFETTSSGVNVVSGTVAGSTHKLSVGKVGSGIGNQKSILELVENTSGSDMNFGFSFTTDGDGSNNLLLRRHNGSTTGAVVMTVNRNDDNVTFAGNLKIQGVSEYADNTAAIAAGLTTGDVYRTGDLLKIVH